MKKIFYKLLCLINFDRLIDFILNARTQVLLLRYARQGVFINFIPQGGYDLMIAGDISKFKIHPTSHLKSGTFIECSGGVEIGRYFHVGRGLTIFSSNHNYKSNKSIPYDDVEVFGPVLINDFVWVGAEVCILPGVEVGEGAIIGMGSVVTKSVPAGAIVGGSPAEILGYRDPLNYAQLKAKEAYY